MRAATAVSALLCLTLTAVPGWVAAGAAHRDCRVRLCDEAPERYSAQDVEAEVRVGREVAAQVLGRLPLHPDPALRRYVALVGQTLALHAGRSEIDYHFAVVSSSEVNAYSTPGGYVFVTSGAVEAMRDEAELAAVLAHEVAHIGARHVVREMNIRGGSSDLFGGAVSLFGASSGAAGVAFRQAVDGAVAILFERGYRMEDELEADRDAVFLLAEVGYDPAALARFLGRLQQSAGASRSAAAAYPTTTERVVGLRRCLSDHGAATITATAENDAPLRERFKAHVRPFQP